MPLHPQSEAFLEQVRLAKAPAWYEMPLDQARRTFSQLPVLGESPFVEIVEDQTIAGVPVRAYRHHATDPNEVIVYFHGGGWVLGNLDSHDAVCRRLANTSKASVVSVDYRNPPEHPFPAAVHDCYDVCQALAVGSSPWTPVSRIVVAGDSAGGNLAMAVALMARGKGEPVLQGQVLIYPVLDSSMSTESYQRYGEGFGLTRNTMAWFWQMYTGDVTTGPRNDPLASPLAAGDLSGLPRTHVLTAEYDVLCDEGATLVRRLMESGVSATHHQQSGMLHGFIHFAGAFDAAIEATSAIGKCCREMLDD